MSKPQDPPEPREPTLKELLALMHADERQFWDSGNGSPKQREEFLEAIKTRWREVTPDYKGIPHSSPTKEQARRGRIRNAYLSGQRPDPEDLAEEEADKLRYQREVDEAIERKVKEVLSPKPQPPADKSKKVITGNSADPKPKGGAPPDFPRHPAGVVSEPPKAPLANASEQPEAAKEQKHWLDAVLESPLLAGVLSVIALGIGFSPKASSSATWVCFIVAWFLFARMVYMLEHIRSKPRRQRLRITAIASFIALIAFFAAGWWLTLPVKTALSNSDATVTAPTPLPRTSSPPTVVFEPTPALVPQSQEANAEIRTTYNRILSSTRDTLKNYQKKGLSNIYVVIPDLHTNLFTPEAFQYKGGVTFSPYAAWFIYLETEPTPEAATNPILHLEFMDGDGKTVGGSGIGGVRFWYDPKTETMNISSTGVGLTAFGKAEQRMSASEFKAAFPAIIKALIEYQLDHL